MTQTLKYSLGLLIFLLLTAAAAGLGTWMALRFAPDKQSEVRETLAGQPGMDAVENFRCPRHLNKSVQFFGIEDGYNRSNDEPARFHQAFYTSPGWRVLVEGDLSSMGKRNYDETGTDKMLFDYFLFPDNVQTAHVIVRLKLLPGSRNDGLSISLPEKMPDGSFELLSTSPATGQQLSDFEILLASSQEEDRILSTDLPDLTFIDDTVNNISISEYLENNPENNIGVFHFQDDHQIDFAALIFCSELEAKRGTTFHESPRKLYKEGRSYLSCNAGPEYAFCDAHRGDLQCDATIPLACYKPGNKPFDGFGSDLVSPNIFTGGEVKLTEPVAGNTFTSRAEVNAYCRESFGDDWAPLKYHEAGGGSIATWSEIEDGTRVWVDVYGAPHANCWNEDTEPAQNP